MNTARRAIGGLTLLIFVGAGSAAAQTASSTGKTPAGAASTMKVVLTPLFAPPGDKPASTVAAAATNALSLMLHLSGSFTVVEAASLDPIMEYRQSIDYYKHLGARLGIFGTVTPDSSGSYTITVQYWQSKDPSAAPVTFTRSVSDSAGAVQAADELAVKVAAAASRRKLAAGTVEVKNLASLARYALYADGHLAARNEASIRLLVGKRTVTVEVPGPGGDHPIESFNVVVKAGETVSVTLHNTAAAVATSEKNGSSASPSPTKAQSTPKPSTGSLTVVTSPEGSTALLDGKRAGTTPLTLASLAPGTHRLRIIHRYFDPVTRTVTVTAGRKQSVSVKLTVNRSDPAIAARIASPLGVAGSTLVWSAAQIAHFTGILAASHNPSGLTSTFLTSGPGFAGGSFPIPVLLDIDFNLSIGRIGGRLIGDSTLTTIDDTFAVAAAAGFASSLLLPQLLGSSQSQQTSYSNAGDALYGVLGTMLFDLFASPLAAADRNQRLITHVSTYGTLPPRRKLPSDHPHRVIIETGADSVARLGIREPLIPNYLGFEESAGLGAVTLQPFVPALAAAAVISYTPWGTLTGRLRPEVFAGLRALTNFSTTGSSIEAEIGTGNDWIGKYFDIFARGGLGYDLTNQHWDQFFSVGTRLF